MDLFLQFILYLDEVDLAHFINYLQEWSKYPNFSAFYDLECFNKDSLYFNQQFNIFVWRKQVVNNMLKDEKE